MASGGGGRLKSYKPLFKDIEETRREREEAGVQLRRRKRDEEFSKRRHLNVAEESHFVVTPPEAAAENTNAIFEKGTPLSVASKELYSEDPKLVLAAANYIRKALSSQVGPPIDEVVELGVLPRFVQMLAPKTEPKLQFEACWVVTNVASGSREQTQTVVDAGAVPALVLLVDSPHENIQEQAIWALGNISGDGAEMRDLVLSQNAVPAFARCLESKPKLKIARNAVWAISNFCRFKDPQCDIKLIEPLFDEMKKWMYEEKDEELLQDLCWAWSFLADGPNHRIQAVVDAGICPRLVELLLHPSHKVVIPALRTVGNIVTGDDAQTQAILDCSVLEIIEPLLCQGKENVRKEACWMLSNVTAGNRAQIQSVLDAHLIPRVIQIFQDDTHKVRKEACWVVGNITSGGSPDQIREMVDLGCIPPLCDFLSVNDPMSVTVALEGLSNVLKVGQMEVRNPGGLNPYSLKIEEAGGLDKVEQLQQHPNEQIYDQAVKIITNYFPADSEEESEND